MPYIVPEKRQALDPVIEDLIRTLRDLSLDDPNDNVGGNLNYVFSVVLNRLYTNGYADIQNAIGLLNCIALEYYRKYAEPYEDSKEYSNGKVYQHPQERMS
jgi:hypothetical protein